MNQTEAQEDLEIAKYKERVKQYQQKVALYQQTYPERNMSQLKKDVGHTPWPGPRGKKDFCRPAGLYYTMFKKSVNIVVRQLFGIKGKRILKMLIYIINCYNW